MNRSDRFKLLGSLMASSPEFREAIETMMLRHIQRAAIERQRLAEKERLFFERIDRHRSRRKRKR